MSGDLVTPAARANRYWNEYTQRMPREKLDAWHLRRIQLLMKHAYDHTSLYRKLYDDAGIKPEDVRTWEDFYYRVPLTDKPDFVSDQLERPFAAQAVPAELMHCYFQTTGTTGAFLKEGFTMQDSVLGGDEFCYGYWDSGMRPGDSVYFSFNWGTWLGLWHVYWGCRRMGLTVYSGGGLSTEERIKAILDIKPTAICGTPTYVLHMAGVARQMGLDPHRAGVKFIIGGGEPGMNIPNTRRALEEGWGAVCIDAYGLSELLVCHVECGAHPGGVHDVESAFHAYSVNPETREPVGDGEVGENIITSYAHTFQPFIKYRTHDLVRRYRQHDHGCGWTWGYLHGSVLGRTDFMVVIRGVNVYPAAVEDVISKVPGSTAYYEIHLSREEGMDRMKLRIEARDGAPSDGYRELGRQAEEIYRQSLGVRIEVEFVAPNGLPRYELKTRRIFDHRPKEVRRVLDQ
ncbi:MAG: phenylacetate--CoA ligase family protein [Dehalococcoidia bacterium]|nr:phenylacetate--CoA ligase family protein [Dehalococcoidia bacterium]